MSGKAKRTFPPLAEEAAKLLDSLGVKRARFASGSREVRSPITGEIIGRLKDDITRDIDQAVERAHKAFLAWRKLPPPRRGELVRLLGEELRAAKPALGALVTLEAGKIVAEGIGEVQEMIDICDFAVGLSRQLYGLTIASERPAHAMSEQWHPLGVAGIITSFNFPVAVWAWNAALALVCGNTLIWKPSERTPLTALAVEAIFARAAAKFGVDAPAGLLSLAIGGAKVGQALVDDPCVALVSATGSTAMGRAVAPRLAQRFARSILELGGNNAAIVCPSADLDLALRAIAFAAMGTAGQRCTSLRRLIVHKSVYADLVARLKRVYRSVAIGDPRDAGVLVGPLIGGDAFEAQQAALAAARKAGGKIAGGERVSVGDDEAYYVRPALVEMPRQADIVKHETFAPILYAMKYDTLDEAIALHNDVPQGLASSIFTTDLREAQAFLSAEGSDCGIANVNIGPSGAEIGGAFGGEKDTGGGRESGSDAWKAYMRRVTSTVNYGNALPLAQGVKFEID
ncbi:MAG TPA: aldehyde dehydrogenase family protein [Stellaceae bacterium]|jgi:aldehyde dehydrogenase (NAD+)|nr:aldehyde dehydrogenase family protein [Stellaceae bacterium]